MPRPRKVLKHGIPSDFQSIEYKASEGLPDWVCGLDPVWWDTDQAARHVGE